MPKSELSVYFLPINAKKPGKVVTGFFYFFYEYGCPFAAKLPQIDYIFVKLEVVFQ